MSHEPESPIGPAEDTSQGNLFPTLEDMAALLPQYEFHNILGVGGMGAVYLARQAALDRWVAIKLLPASASSNEEDAGRFITEARSMAKLIHPNIAAVHDFGQTALGHLYLVMEYVHGQDLHRVIQEGGVPQPQIRKLVIELCEALQFAHDHGVIHRDIKPANILITENFQAKIVDFGLAQDKGLHAAGEVEYGTPDYVAPERLTPGAVVDRRSDIYSLGVVIHEMFTRLTPQAAGEHAGHGMPPEYISIVNRCMAAEPAQRFQNCSEIKTYLSAGAALHAAAATAPAAAAAPAQQRPLPPHLRPQVQRSTMPQPKPQGGGGKWLWAAACLALVGAGAWFVLKQRAAGETSEVASKTTSPEETPPADKETPPKQDTPAMPKAPVPTVVSNGSMGPFQPAAGGFAVLNRLKGHSELVYSCAILADQRRAISGGHDDTLILWDLASGARLQTFPSPVGDVHGISASKDGSRVLVWSFRTDQVSIFDADTGTSQALIRSPTDTLSNVAWAVDEKSAYLLCKNTDGGIYHWDPSKGAVIEKLSEWPRAAFHAFPLPPDAPGGSGRLLVMGSTLKPAPNSQSGAAQAMVTDKPWAAMFSTPDHRLIREIPDYKNLRNELSLSPDGSAIAGGLGVIYLLDVPALTTRGSIPQHSPQASTQASSWAAGGRMLLIGYSDGLLRLCEADSGTELERLDIGLRASEINISQDNRWAVISGFPLDQKNPKPDDFDVLIVRLPDVNKLGTDEGFLSFARRQLAKLDSIDPELDALRTGASMPDSIADDDHLRAQVIDLTGKYGAALARSAATAAPGDQQAMRQEAEAIAAGHAVPDSSTDAATTGDHKRFRDIYRQQLAQLAERRQTSAATLLQKLSGDVQTLADKRRQEGDRLGAARCSALLAALSDLQPFDAVVASAFSTPAPSATPVAASLVAATAPPPAPPPQGASLPPAMPPPVTTTTASAAPKMAFSRGVRTDVSISRPSKAAVYDDVTQVITPKFKLTNTTSDTYTGYKAVFFLIGESAAQRGIYKVLARHEFEIALPPKETLESEGETYVTKYDSNASNGATFGYKYDGWVIQIIAPSNAVEWTKSTSQTLEKMAESIQALKVDQCYDRKWKPVTNPPY